MSSETKRRLVAVTVDRNARVREKSKENCR